MKMMICFYQLKYPFNRKQGIEQSNMELKQEIYFKEKKIKDLNEKIME